MKIELSIVLAADDCCTVKIKRDITYYYLVGLICDNNCLAPSGTQKVKMEKNGMKNKPCTMILNLADVVMQNLNRHNIELHLLDIKLDLRYIERYLRYIKLHLSYIELHLFHNELHLF